MAGPLARARYAIGHRRRLLGTIRELRRAKEAETPSAAVEAAFAPRERELSVQPVQVPSEITRFLGLVRRAAPRHVLEIGTSNGGTLYLLSWASAADAGILSLDVKEFPPDRLRLYGSFGGRRQRLEVRRADSQEERTRDEVRDFFDGQPLDLLFIDGDHSYEGIRRDYELYAPLVRPGGLIALHDIVDGAETMVGGVPRFWREIRGELDEATELVESWEQGGFGIGVGRRPGSPG